MPVADYSQFEDEDYITECTICGHNTLHVRTVVVAEDREAVEYICTNCNDYCLKPTKVY